MIHTFRSRAIVMLQRCTSLSRLRDMPICACRHLYKRTSYTAPPVCLSRTSTG